MKKVIYSIFVAVIALLWFVLNVQSAIGSDFYDHGVPVPISEPKGIVATVDSEGNNIVVAWLYDFRGGYELILIDAMTGNAEEFPFSFSPNGDCPFSSILSSQNKFYTHFAGHFVEFDIGTKSFSFVKETTPKTAMSMTEDDNGTIWSATYPKNALFSYNPKTGIYKDYGQIHAEEWSQYPRYIATDDKGWVYVGMGEGAGQITAFNPISGEFVDILPQSERETGLAYVYRDLNGKVYGRALNLSSFEWYELYEGKGKKIGFNHTVNKKPFISSAQTLFYKQFPDGERIQKIDFESRELNIEKNSTVIRRLTFDYSSEGCPIMSVGVAPDGTIAGGTSFPMFFFNYNPKTNKSVMHSSFGQWNTVVSQSGRLYVGAYGSGKLLEWDPLKLWVATEKGNSQSNPIFRCEGTPDIYRPHKILAHVDGKTIILGGTPGYGLTGGGLLFWDTKTSTKQILKHTEIVPELSTRSLVSLSSDQILGGTTTAPGTGGVKKASEAELYLMDVNSKKILWHQAVLPGVQDYLDLCLAENGLVYGVASGGTFFVFDPNKRKLVFQTYLRGPLFGQQGQRNFIICPNGIYLLYHDAIGKIDPETFTINRVLSPVSITAGGAYLDGHIYFASGAKLYSYIVDAQLGRPGNLRLK